MTIILSLSAPLPCIPACMHGCGLACHVKQSAHLQQPHHLVPLPARPPRRACHNELIRRRPCFHFPSPCSQLLLSCSQLRLLCSQLLLLCSQLLETQKLPNLDTHACKSRCSWPQFPASHPVDRSCPLQPLPGGRFGVLGALSGRHVQPAAVPGAQRGGGGGAEAAGQPGGELLGPNWLIC